MRLRTARLRNPSHPQMEGRAVRGRRSQRSQRRPALKRGNEKQCRTHRLGYTEATVHPKGWTIDIIKVDRVDISSIPGWTGGVWILEEAKEFAIEY